MRWLGLLRPSQEDSAMISFFLVNFTAKYPEDIGSRGAEWERVGEISNFQPISCRISERVQDRIGPRLLWRTNRKLHKPICVVDWYQNHRPWMTLNGRYALYCRKDAYFGQHTAQKFEWRSTHTISGQNLGQWLVSGNIRCMRIFAGVPRSGGVKRQWGCRRLQFLATSVAASSETLEIRTAL